MTKTMGDIRSSKDTKINITEIEKLLLPVTLTSQIPHARTMVYKCIKTYLGVPFSTTPGTFRVTMSRYYNSEPVLAYLNMVKSEIAKKENPDEENLEVNEDGTITKESLVKWLKQIMKHSSNTNSQINANKAIATIMGFTRPQKEKKATKNIYVPITCNDCPLYIQAKENINNKDQEV